MKADIFCDDCFNVFKDIKDKTVDMILCDLPYGIKSRNEWDIPLDLDKLWAEYERVIKDNGAIVLHAAQPFTSKLILSNLKLFKYTWVWDKMNKVSGFLNAKKQPLRVSEDIVVFYKNQPKYNPQMVKGKPYKAVSKGGKSNNYGKQKDGVVTVCDGNRYPKNIIKIEGDERKAVGRIHPTQKPIALAEYLIKTYTDENDLVLDNCMGSGTTGVACVKTGRNFIGIEKHPQYFEICKNRIFNLTNFTYEI